MCAADSMPGDLRTHLVTRYSGVRSRTEALAAPLSPEDQQLQSMPDCSPTKWHRAHTTWFFETFVLLPRKYAPVDPAYAYLFNSYYEAVGPRHLRPRRGMISRPGVEEVARYRQIVDGRVLNVLESASEADLWDLAPLIDLGLAHEEQHQELLLTDILNALSNNPTQPAYQSAYTSPAATAHGPESPDWVHFEGGVQWVGADIGGGFTFDNEGPRHRVWLEPFALASRLVTVGEMKDFIRAGGYANPALWLSAGMDFVRSHQLTSPYYTTWADGQLTAFGLTGARVPADDEPISHLSFYEADAVCRFLGGRLPTEAEWEVAAAEVRLEGNWADSGVFHPLPAGRGPGLQQLFGDVWEWTRSGYEPYPGYVAGPGALGEYNGKFMANQQVLRGGSCFSPRGHLRVSYRNFWPADTRFQMTGVRVAKDL